jgi:hypothetical protein
MTGETPGTDGDPACVSVCAGCGGLLAADAGWCPACIVFVRPDALAAQFRAQERANPVVPVYSRTKGGVLSFGLLGRIVCSAVVLGVFWWLVNALWPFAIIWFVIAVPYGLRDIWKRTRIK